MAYSTSTKVSNMFGITLTAAQSAALVDIIAAVKIFIDRYCGKTFEAPSEARYYDWHGSREIVIDSFVGNITVEFLNADGTTARTLTVGADHDYIIVPYNNQPDGLTEKNTILLTNSGWSGSTGWWYSSLPTGTRAIKVTGSFGASTTVPADIQLAATKLSGLMLQENTDGILTSIRLGDYQAVYENVEKAAGTMGVMDILDSYRDIEI